MIYFGGHSCLELKLMLTSILHILFWLIFSYCAISVLYLLVLALGGRFLFNGKYNGVSAQPKTKIAVLVPAYKEDNIILSTARYLLEIDYPSSLIDIYIIADSFQADTLERLKKLPLQVIEVSFDKSTKTKSLNEAFSRISDHYDLALICDADNILHRDFLRRLDYAFTLGARSMQGRRVAKNLDSSFAILDACSEGINNNIFRKGANGLGLSSAVIGSGMAFEYHRLKSILANIKAIGGFDKILQLEIVSDDDKIRYLDKALIFDEKIDSSSAFTEQRKRWVASQFMYLRRFFVPAVSKLFKGNLSYFNLAIGNNLVLPRAFLLMLLPALVVAGLFLPLPFLVSAIVLLALYMLTLGIALPGELVTKDLFTAMMRLPTALGSMFLALLHMKKAKSSFIHTVHTKTEVTNTLFNDHGN